MGWRSGSACRFLARTTSPSGGNDGDRNLEAADRLTRAAAAHGVEAQPLSSFHLKRPARPGLVLGYAAYDEREIRDGVKRLSAALRSLVGARNVLAKRRG